MANAAHQKISEIGFSLTMVGWEGIEPSTSGLRVRCSTN